MKFKHTTVYCLFIFSILGGPLVGGLADAQTAHVLGSLEYVDGGYISTANVEFLMAADTTIRGTTQTDGSGSFFVQDLPLLEKVVADTFKFAVSVHDTGNASLDSAIVRVLSSDLADTLGTGLTANGAFNLNYTTIADSLNLIAEVAKTGYVGKVIPFTAFSGMNNLNILLTPIDVPTFTYAINGTVRDDGNKIVSGGKLVFLNSADTGDTLAVTTTQADGTYNTGSFARLEKLSGANVDITKKGYHDKKGNIKLAEGENKRDFTIEKINTGIKETILPNIHPGQIDITKSGNQYGFSVNGKADKAQIFNILGQHVATVPADYDFSNGASNLQWDPRNDFGSEIASGTYFVRFETGNGNAVRKFTHFRGSSQFAVGKQKFPEAQRKDSQIDQLTSAPTIITPTKTTAIKPTEYIFRFSPSEIGKQFIPFETRRTITEGLNNIRFQEATQEQITKTPDIKTTIRNAVTWNPMKDMTVFIEYEDGTRFQSTTNDSGAAIFKDMQAGGYRFLVPATDSTFAKRTYKRYTFMTPHSDADTLQSMDWTVVPKDLIIPGTGGQTIRVDSLSTIFDMLDRSSLTNLVAGHQIGFYVAWDVDFFQNLLAEGNNLFFEPEEQGWSFLATSPYYMYADLSEYSYRTNPMTDVVGWNVYKGQDLTTPKYAYLNSLEDGILRGEISVSGDETGFFKEVFFRTGGFSAVTSRPSIMNPSASAPTELDRALFRLHVRYNMAKYKQGFEHEPHYLSVKQYLE